MKNIFLAPKDKRAFWQKLVALFLTVSMNLSVGGLGVFLLPSVAYAADTGFQSPTNTATPSEWSSPSNAFSSDNAYATATDDTGMTRDDQRYVDFNFVVPNGAAINGIEVVLEGHSTDLIGTTVGSFGTGSTVTDVPEWTEDSVSSGSTTVALAPGSGDDTASPDGGRFARIADNGYICYAVDGTDLSSLVMKYYWRGDADAEDGESATVQYKTGVSCSNTGSWTTLATHELDNDDANVSSWSSLQSVNIPDLNTFVVRFKNGNQSSSDENFRVDGVSLTSNSSCKIEARIGDGTNFSSYKSATLTNTDASYTLGGPSDLWSGVTWSSNDFSNANFRLEVRGDDPGSSCHDGAVLNLDHAQAKVHFTPVDTDADGVADQNDNCSLTANPQQENADGDNLGDACDTETDLTSCTDVLDNDGDQAIDLADADCAEFKPQITVEKIVYGGQNPSSFFDIFINLLGGEQNPIATLHDGDTITVNPGSYSILEAPYANYNVGYAGNCNPNNMIAGDHATCTVTNTYVPPTTYACSDDVDNDQDGLIDMEDPGCANAEDNDESNAPTACNPEINLLENEGFEAPEVPTNEWDIISFADPLLKWLGAFVSPQEGGRLGLEFQAGVAGAPFEGRQLAELDGDHPTTIWQDVATIPGKEYQLDLKFSPRPNTPLADNVLQILAGGVELSPQVSMAGTDVTTWTPLTRTFVATSSVTRVQFADLGTDNSYGTYLDDTSLRCIGDPVPKATVMAYKVVCDNESDLPNWGTGGPDITANTANDWINGNEELQIPAHESCRLASGWSFQHAPQGTANPGDSFYGEAATPWTTFGLTGDNGMVSTQVPLVSDGGDGYRDIYLREVLQDGFTPFTYNGQNNNNNVSAEFYCSDDVLNYDNLDYVRNSENDAAYYCVGFNAPQHPEETPNIHIVKYIDGEPANGDERHINSFFDVFTEISRSDESSVQKNVSLNGGNNFHDSFFDVFTEIRLQEVINDGENGSMTMPIGSENCPSGKYRLSGYSTGGTLEEAAENGVEHRSSVNVSPQGDSTYVIIWNETCPSDEEPEPSSPPQESSIGSGDPYTYGCTNPLATNYNGFANRDDGSCVLPQGGGESTTTPETGGEVLGAATVTEEQPAPQLVSACTEYLRDYLGYGKKNDSSEVKKLQIFLNEHMNANIPLTGFFGSVTRGWVKKFQTMYFSDILQPWIDSGHKPSEIKDGTGYVFKTTKRKINLLKCDSLNIPIPDLTSVSR